MLFSSFPLLTLLTLSSALPRPESVGAGGPCSDPELDVTSVTKVKQGPFLVSGARVDANPSGGAASFTKTYNVAVTVQGGAGLDLDHDFSQLLKKGLGLEASFSISKTTITGVSGTVICPTNTLKNDTITWGLIHWDYKYTVTGTKSYGGYNPLMNHCSADEIEHAGEQGVPFSITSPALQGGSDEGASAEVEFQCCTDSRSGGWVGSPVCPDAD
ncbi:MAG: hypothetical protein L6R37_006449 [Teloschistes peruensis]|nr:MAG: hypothetical protein L6R37_006449 [Teloschistes peruensis]